MQVFKGVVENRQDPLKLGRCQVRIIGLHTHDKNLIRTDDLPWAYPVQPVTSAAMSGIGHAPVGPVEGTWVLITFADEDLQYPIMIGTLGGIPQNDISIDQDPDSITFKDDKGNVQSTPVDVVSDGSATPTQATTPPETAPTTTTATPTTTTTDITTEPPPDFKTLRDKRKQWIVALLAACDKLGIKSREVKCSILACAGGESGFLPQDELYNYSSKEHLANTFVTTFKKKHPEKAEEYTNAKKKGMTAYDFFSFVYLTENNGAGLGNRNADDAGKYIGRGLTGITGYNNYKYYGEAIGADLLGNPNLLNNDVTISALASAYMIKDNTKKKFPKVSETDHPGYFYAAKRAQGKDTGNGAETRLKYYEYFYGAAAGNAPAEEKSADASANSSTPAETGNVQSNSTGSGPSAGSPGQVGFKDPNNKYPLKAYIHEPDTNRLARGIKSGTVHQNKDGNRVIGIKQALSDDTIDEPKSAYNSKYPYNHVFESESGHVTEIDDTPGYERMMTYHRKGTFMEIDPNGTEVKHIVGDKYEIIDRNGIIYIRGNANITVDGSINILCQSDANIEVTGDAEMKVGGGYKLDVANDMTVSVGGEFKLNSQGSMYLQTNANYNSVAIGNHSSYSVGALHLKASGNFNLDATRVDMNNGTAVGATSINLPFISAGSPLNPSMALLEIPEAEGESVFLLETDEEWASPAGQAAKKELEAKYGPPPESPQDSTEPTGGTNNTTVASCDIIHGITEFTKDFKLSQNFTLGMLIPEGWNGDNKLQDQVGLTKQQIVCNLSQLCINILEPLMALVPNGIAGFGKTWKLNSGFRGSGNIPPGGSKTSDHMTGRAIDFTLLPYDNTKKDRNYALAVEIDKKLPYDQLIMEYKSPSSNWVHIGYRGAKAGETSGPGNGNRKMAFTMVNGDTYKKDGKGGLFLL